MPHFSRTAEVVERAKRLPLVAQNGHGAMSDLSPLSEAKRKSGFGAVRSASGPDCVKTVLNDMILQRFGGGFDDALCRWR
jgi:hypothetical protein